MERLQPPSCLVAGEAGSGKTDALTTYIEAGKELFVLVTEPGGVDSLLDSCERRKLPVDKLHWATALPSSGAWSAMEDMINNIGNLDYEGLSKIKSGIGKPETRKAAMQFLNVIKNFHCERTGRDFGDMTTWDDTRAFALDSLSGMSMIAWHLTLGYKPTANPGEWNVAMNFIEQMLLKITADRSCHLTVNAHIEKEHDEMTGAKKLMVSTLGSKLAPKIPKYFSEVIMAKRLIADGKYKFEWSTIDANMALKNRALPVNAVMAPSFVPVVEAYERRKKAAIQATATEPAPATPNAA